MDVDHEAPGLLRPLVVGVGVRPLRRRVLAGGRRLAVAEAEEGEVKTDRLISSPFVSIYFLSHNIIYFISRTLFIKSVEQPVVLGVGLKSLGADGHRDVHVHHLHGTALPVEDGATLRHALRPQGHHHVHGEPLAGLDLAHDLERQLLGDEVQRVT